MIRIEVYRRALGRVKLPHQIRRADLADIAQGCMAQHVFALQGLIVRVAFSNHLHAYSSRGLAMKRRIGIAALALLGGIAQSHADARRGDFAYALYYSSKCPAYELDPERAMEVAVSVGFPNTPSSITVTASEGTHSMISNAVPFLGHPEPAQLSDSDCKFAYSLFGPKGTKIPGMLRPRTTE